MSVRNAMTFTSLSPVWLSRYLWWKSKFHFSFSLLFLLHYSLLGKMSMVKPVTQRFLLFLRHFITILKRIFFRVQYYTVPQTLITGRAMHLRFNIVKRCLWGTGFTVISLLTLCTGGILDLLFFLRFFGGPLIGLAKLLLSVALLNLLQEI